MTKTVVFDGKAKRAGLVRAGTSKSKMNITSELQDRTGGVSTISGRTYEITGIHVVRTDVFPTLQGTGMQRDFPLSTL